jgi:broad specificity phosphatase PhoE
MGLILLRHPAVARAWAGRCYGSSDVPLSRAGRASIPEIVESLEKYHIDTVVHSGVARTRPIAEAVAAAFGVPVVADPAWRERDFGTWEGRSWNAIWRETGNAMDGMTEAPANFRPGDTGETTHELRDRVLAAHARLPEGGVLVVTHGGPIAALLGTLAGESVERWPALVPPCGTFRVIREQMPLCISV